MNISKKILSHNWFAIFYFNLKMLPLKQAIKFPFDFYYKVRFENLSGKVILNSSSIQRGMIKLGGRGSEMYARSPVILDLKKNSKIIFNGASEFGAGVLLRAENNATISFGNNVRIGALSKIFCEERIVFGNEIDFSWECQIFDTNFHDIKNMITEEVPLKTKTILIGSYNWFGNRVNVMKGTITPDNMVIASNSLCNKDYSDIPPNSLLAGIPAKFIKTGIKRIFEKCE